MDVLENLKVDFDRHISFSDKRPGIVQVVAPLFHEDGDMLDIFLDIGKASENGNIRISDYGMTLMRLSYSYEIDTPTKQKVLDKILAENGVIEDNGSLYIEAPPRQCISIADAVRSDSSEGQQYAGIQT